MFYCHKFDTNFGNIDKKMSIWPSDENTEFSNKIVLTPARKHWQCPKQTLHPMVPETIKLKPMFSVSITNIASNTATANVLVPILADLAVTMCINPIYLTLPAGILVKRLWGVPFSSLSTFCPRYHLRHCVYPLPFLAQLHIHRHPHSHLDHHLHLHRHNHHHRHPTPTSSPS